MDLGTDSKLGNFWVSSVNCFNTSKPTNCYHWTIIVIGSASLNIKLGYVIISIIVSNASRSIDESTIRIFAISLNATTANYSTGNNYTAIGLSLTSYYNLNSTVYTTSTILTNQFPLIRYHVQLTFPAITPILLPIE